ncbi:MAG: hypothetical protein JOZ72_13865 [Alphaproteobacteria bacterium]|nr:hypothetical protein [Alphaproteobacteria bacterium]
MELVQILLPLADNDGRPFPEALLRRIQQELADRFGGLTAYERSPAKGVWMEGDRSHRDEVVILKVMTDAVNDSWWRRFRERLERDLQQKELVIRALPVRRL